MAICQRFMAAIVVVLILVPMGGRAQGPVALLGIDAEYSYPYGNIAGKVFDKATNEPMPGTNVLVEGTTLGAACDAEGYYRIQNVPVGSYTVCCQMIGYGTVCIKNVPVFSNSTTEVNFALNAEAIQGTVTEIEYTGEGRIRGPIDAYRDIVQSVMDLASVHGNTGKGILVIGGGKSNHDDVTRFWKAMGALLGEPVTFINGPFDILKQSFREFRLIAVASSNYRVSGGLTKQENDILGLLYPRMYVFVNDRHGGVLGFTQYGLDKSYAYLTGIPRITFSSNNMINQITPTAYGRTFGIPDNDLDVNYWHDVYLEYPANLYPLARDTLGRVVALGDSVMSLPLYRPHSAVSFHVGSSHPGKDMDEDIDANIYFQLDFIYPFAPRHELQLRVGMAQFTAETAANIPHPYYECVTLNWMYLMGLFSNGFRVYSSLGAGYYMPKDGDDVAGANVGGTFRMPIDDYFSIDFGIDGHILMDDPMTVFYTFKLGVVYQLARRRHVRLLAGE